MHEMTRARVAFGNRVCYTEKENTSAPPAAKGPKEGNDMKIYLVRHGETDWNKAGRLQGQCDVPLNEYGIRLAEETARGLSGVPFDAAFSSPLSRAAQTAGIILGDRKVPLCPDDRLKEIGFGVMEAVDYLQARQDPENPISRFFREPEKYQPPEGGESFQQLYDRSAAFLREKILPLEGRAEAVLIAGHGALNRSILNPLTGTPLRDFWRIPMPNCAVALLSLEDGKLKVLEECKVYYEGAVRLRP